jgi:Uri superfamily endonuclease
MIKPGEIPTDPASLSFCQPLPKFPGTYALFLHLPESRQLRVGGLGELFFPAGDYIYLGSACGPGGLRARLGRHLRGHGTPRWHIDYLRELAPVSGYSYLKAGQGAQNLPERSLMPGREKLECRWSQALAALPGASVPAPGFGASDCSAGCRAHLVAFSHEVDTKKICSALARSAAVPHAQLISFYQD